MRDIKKANSNALLRAEVKTYKELKRYLADKEYYVGDEPEYKRLYANWYPIYQECQKRKLVFLSYEEGE